MDALQAPADELLVGPDKMGTRERAFGILLQLRARHPVDLAQLSYDPSEDVVVAKTPRGGQTWAQVRGEASVSLTAIEVQFGTHWRLRAEEILG